MPETVFIDAIYSLISGFTAFFGVDASAHQRLFSLLTGGVASDSGVNMAVRFGTLVALLICCGPHLRRLLRERSHSLRSHRLKRQADPIAQLDLKLVRTAMLPVLAGVFLYSTGSRWIAGFLPLALTLLLNSFILFLPRVINSGNKDGRSVSPLDGLLLGCGSVFGAFPGFSRVGCMMTAAAIGGLDRAYAMEMSLLLSIPVLAGLLVFDLFALLAGQIALSLVTLILYLVYAAMALLGSWLTIILMRYLVQKIGFTGFAYYSLGLALFSFIFYLVI